MLAIRAARMFDGERFTNGGVTVVITTAGSRVWSLAYPMFPTTGG